MTTHIKQADLIETIAGALQYISYYHPADYIAHLARAYEAEQGPAAKDAIAQILTNSRMSATGHRPICQDTGIVNVFLKIGMDVRFDGFTGTIDDAFVDGVVNCASEAVKPHIHTDFQEHVDDASVLADRAMPSRAHAAVGQNLGNRVFRGRAFFCLIRARQVGDVVRWMVVADVLQRACNGFDEVGLFDVGDHEWLGKLKISVELCFNSPKFNQISQSNVEAVSKPG